MSGKGAPTDTEQKQEEEITSKESEGKIGQSVAVIELPYHLNGSVKMPTSSAESHVNEDTYNRSEISVTEKGEEEPHSMSNWPAMSGKFAKVGNKNFTKIFHSSISDTRITNF